MLHTFPSFCHLQSYHVFSDLSIGYRLFFEKTVKIYGFFGSHERYAQKGKPRQRPRLDEKEQKRRYAYWQRLLKQLLAVEAVVSPRTSEGLQVSFEPAMPFEIAPPSDGG